MFTVKPWSSGDSAASFQLWHSIFLWFYHEGTHTTNLPLSLLHKRPLPRGYTRPNEREFPGFSQVCAQESQVCAQESRLFIPRGTVFVVLSFFCEVNFCLRWMQNSKERKTGGVGERPITLKNSQNTIRCWILTWGGPRRGWAWCGEPRAAPSPHFPSPLALGMCLGQWRGAISKCAQQNLEASWPFQKHPLPSFLGFDLPSRSCSQSPGQTRPILGKQMNTMALSLPIRLYHSFPEASNRWTIQLWGRGEKIKKRPMWHGAWGSPCLFSLSWSWHHLIVCRVVSLPLVWMKCYFTLEISNGGHHFLCPNALHVLSLIMERKRYFHSIDEKTASVIISMLQTRNPGLGQVK